MNPLFIDLLSSFQDLSVFVRALHTFGVYSETFYPHKSRSKIKNVLKYNFQGV
jgi:hypothetical protein